MGPPSGPVPSGEPSSQLPKYLQSSLPGGESGRWFVLTAGSFGPGCGLMQFGEPYLQIARAGDAIDTKATREEAMTSLRKASNEAEG